MNRRRRRWAKARREVQRMVRDQRVNYGRVADIVNHYQISMALLSGRLRMWRMR